MDKFHALGVIAVAVFDLQRTLEVVEYGDQLADRFHAGVLGQLQPVLFDTAAEVLELGLGPQDSLLQLGLFGLPGWSRVGFDRPLFGVQVSLVGNTFAHISRVTFAAKSASECILEGLRKTNKWLLLPVLAVAALAADVLWWEPASFTIHRASLVLPGWRTDLRVAALSDLHIGSWHVGLDKLRYIVEKTNAEKPDIVVITGDFVIGGPRGDGPSRAGFVPPEQIAEGLKGLRAPTYAVLGNHDRWFDGSRVEAALSSAGITVLENKAARIEHDGRAFWLGGISDLWTSDPDIRGTLAQANPDEPVLLFTHNPDIFPDVPSRVSLTIAGHTHGGQVDIPFYGTPVDGVSKYRRGHYVESGRHLFVTTGVGTSIAPVRFRVTPELAMLLLSSGTF